VRVFSGEIKKGQQAAWCRRNGTIERVRIAELFRTEALERVPADRAGPGDIIAVRGHRRHHDRRDPGRPR